MKRLLATAAFAACLATGNARAVEIEVAYAFSHLFDITFEKSLEEFRRAHPDITVKFRASYEDYEDGSNTVLRESVSGSLPDITLQGLNHQAVLVEKGIARSLEPFIAKEADFSKDGYHKAMLDLSTFNGDVYGLPFSISLPVSYYNMDLLRDAGITELPRSWDQVIAACDALKAKGVRNPLFWGWNVTGNWFLQALMWSQGEPTVKDGRINLGGQAGLVALETMKSLFRSCNMKNLTRNEAFASFSAGEIGMMFWSTSAYGAIERAKGDFELKTHEFPGIDRAPIGLPAGGNAAMLVSQSDDPERLKAAWTFLKFITSGTGAAVVAETTGYIPPNKVANEVILKDFYTRNPNKETAVRQLPLLRDWQAYPGDNGLAVIQVIYDAIESIVVGDRDDMAALQTELVEEVSEMLPQN